MALRIEASLNTTGFKQGLDVIRTQTKAFTNSVEHEVTSSWGGIGKTLAGAFAGLATVEGVKGAVDRFIETGKQIAEQAEQVDMSTVSWQKWTQAVKDAGLNAEGFQRIAETLREKRTAALTDPKARGELNQLGFSDSDITGEMDMSEFIKRALANANGGDLQRKRLGDIIGNRGLKYSSAANGVDSQTPEYSRGELGMAKSIGMSEEHASRFLGRLINPFVGMLLSPFAPKNKDWSLRGTEQTPEEKAAAKAAEEAQVAAMNRNQNFQEILEDAQTKNPKYMAGIIDALGSGNGFGFSKEQLAKLSPHLSPENMAKITAPTGEEKEAVKNDPLTAQLDAQKEELALRKKEREQSLADKQRDDAARSEDRQFRMADQARGMMTIGDRRAEIAAEIPGLKSEIDSRNAAAPGLFGDDEKEVADRRAKLAAKDNEAFLTDKQKADLNGITGTARTLEVNRLRASFEDITDTMANKLEGRKSAYQARTDELQERENKDKADLRQKPLSFGADSMAKVGLYESSAVAFNPLLNISQRQLTTLEQIARNTSQTKTGQSPQQSDPHHP